MSTDPKPAHPHKPAPAQKPIVAFLKDWMAEHETFTLQEAADAYYGQATTPGQLAAVKLAVDELK